MLGAGPAGSVAAMLLARAGAGTLLVDECKSTVFRVGESLPGIAQPLFGSLQLPGLLKSIPTIACSGNRSAWGTARLETRQAIFDPYGPGIHIDRAAFDKGVLSAALDEGVELLAGRFIRSAADTAGWGLSIQTANGVLSVRSRWVIDCTGRRSSFATSQKVKRIAFDNQVAVTGWFEQKEGDTDRSITIEAAPDGWWYSAPIPHARRIVVYFTDGDLLAQVRVRSVEGFRALAESTCHIRPFVSDAATALADPIVFLASTSRLEKPSGDFWIAAGDAAAALDPLASIGIIDSVQGARAAVQAVIEGSGQSDAYATQIVRQHAKNVETRHAYYKMESRWPQSTFWSRRHLG